MLVLFYSLFFDPFSDTRKIGTGAGYRASDRTTSGQSRCQKEHYDCVIHLNFRDWLIKEYVHVVIYYMKYHLWSNIF